MTVPPDPNAPGWGAMPGPYGQQPQQPQQPPGWGGPPGYGGGYPPQVPPPYAYYGAPPTDGKAVGALVSSILAWVICPVIAAVVALVLAHLSSRDIRASGGRLQGDGFNTAARIISWINIVLTVLAIAFLIAVGAAVESTTPDYDSGVETQFGGCRRTTVDARQVPC